jgi:hypothetical protein
MLIRNEGEMEQAANVGVIMTPPRTRSWLYPSNISIQNHHLLVELEEIYIYLSHLEHHTYQPSTNLYNHGGQEELWRERQKGLRQRPKG